MDHIAICLAILLWLIRPQDWLSGFAGVGFMKYVMIAGMFGVWARQKTEGWRLFQSPIDYAVVFHLAWIVLTTGDYFNTAKEVLPFGIFYFTTALSLNSLARMRSFMNCWVTGLFVVALFALSTHWGSEMAAGSADLTEIFDGRLALNTWIFNNPNSLGHGVVALIPLCYVWLWWRRPLMIKAVAILVIYTAGYCVYLTQSKGAYLCGAAALGVVILFRQKFIIQAFLIILAMTAGVAALKLLPRMDTMSANEDGIAGRLIIWQMAHNAMTNTDTGEGWKKFEAWVTIPKVGVIKKATHGSYVNVGADLGYPGLFLFLSVLYCAGRIVLQSRPPADDVDAGRLQRALLSLLASYGASAWMIDRAYHTDFFFIAGVIAAFHRLSAVPSPGAADADLQGRGEHQGFQTLLAQVPSLIPGVAMTSAAFVKGGLSLSSAVGSEFGAGGSGAGEGTLNISPKADPWLSWKRIGLLDILLMYGLFEAVLYIWVEIMTHFVSF